jgi:CRP-like cAMP-binding protein
MNPTCAVTSNFSHPVPRRRLENLESLAVTKQYHRDQEVCGQTHPSECWHRVTVGAARKCVTLSSGRRQIVDLLLPGDFFDGTEPEEERDFTVEAVTEGTTVVRYPRRRVEQLAETDPELASEIRRIDLEIISRLQELILILGRTTALDKVGCFLLVMAQRPFVGRGNAVALPISRYDIADYLGLSVETVSRSLTELKHRRVITLTGTRQVTIINRNALAEGEYHSGASTSARLHHPISVPCQTAKSLPAKVIEEHRSGI